MALFDPAVLRGSLAGGAAAVEAGVVERHLAAAVAAAVEVTAENGGATGFESGEDAVGFGAEGVPVAVRSGKAAEDLGDLELRTRTVTCGSEAAAPSPATTAEEVDDVGRKSHRGTAVDGQAAGGLVPRPFGGRTSCPVKCVTRPGAFAAPVRRRGLRL